VINKGGKSMNRVKLWIIVIFVMLMAFSSGCSEQKEATMQPKENKTTAEDVKQEAKEMVQTTTTYTMEQKEAYEQKLAEKLETYNQQISTLKQQMVMLQGEAEQKLQDQINSLQTKVEDMKNRSDELKDAGGEAWNNLKDGLDKAGDDLDQAFTEAMQKFTKSSSSY
jgi:TolA-binding protein